MEKVEIDFDKDFPLEFDKNKKIHFVAVGGIGVSAVAKCMQQLGYQVSGSDIKENKNTNALKEKGANIFIGHKSSNIDGVGALIVSSAIKKDNPEIIAAQNQNIPIFHRSQGLNAITKGLGFDKKPISIGLSGTHGKTTTTGMTTLVFEVAKKSPTFLIGGFLPQLKTNAQAGSGDFVISEMDESDGTIVLYSTDVLLITNLEVDHVDYYTNGLEQIIDTFKTVVSKTQKVVLNIDDYGCKKLYSNIDKNKIVTYSIKSENADFYAKNIHLKENKTVFDVYQKSNLLGQIELKIPGIHNVSNALGVLIVCLEAGLSFSDIKNGLHEFVGTGRRFEFVGKKNEAKYYDDYAHHPTEVKATIESAKQLAGRVVAVFQPHRYTRFQGFWEEFKDALKSADEVIITDVYSAGEDEIENVNSEKFAKEVEGFRYFKGDTTAIANQLKDFVRPNDIVLTLGAGTITEVGYKICQI